MYGGLQIQHEQGLYLHRPDVSHHSIKTKSDGLLFATGGSDTPSAIRSGNVLGVEGTFTAVYGNAYGDYGPRIGWLDSGSSGPVFTMIGGRLTLVDNNGGAGITGTRMPMEVGSLLANLYATANLTPGPTSNSSSTRTPPSRTSTWCPAADNSTRTTSSMRTSARRRRSLPRNGQNDMWFYGANDAGDIWARVIPLRLGRKGGVAVSGRTRRGRRDGLHDAQVPAGNREFHLRIVNDQHDNWPISLTAVKNGSAQGNMTYDRDQNKWVFWAAPGSTGSPIAFGYGAPAAVNGGDVLCVNDMYEGWEYLTLNANWETEHGVPLRVKRIHSTVFLSGIVKRFGSLPTSVMSS